MKLFSRYWFVYYSVKFHALAFWWLWFNMYCVWMIYSYCFSYLILSGTTQHIRWMQQYITVSGFEQACTNPGCQVTQATTFCMVVPYICVYSVQFCFSPFCNEEFSGGFKIFGKFMYPWLWDVLTSVAIILSFP